MTGRLNLELEEKEKTSHVLRIRDELMASPRALFCFSSHHHFSCQLAANANANAVIFGPILSRRLSLSIFFDVLYPVVPRFRRSFETCNVLLPGIWPRKKGLVQGYGVRILLNSSLLFRDNTGCSLRRAGGMVFDV